MNSKKVWDTSEVYSLRDILWNSEIPEAMFGRVFTILGIKNEELGDDRKVWKARCVFQESNVRTNARTFAADLFEETSNEPASFAGTRAAIGVAALRGFNASLRDAETAYLQAVIDTPTRTPTFVELLRELWPDTWFQDRALRQIPKNDRPHCRLLRALYGHPEAGALWEARLDNIMKTLGWSPISGNG